MCNLRSRKRLLDSETVMEGPMGSLSGNITDATNCLFHHGQVGIPVSGSMFTPDYCPSTADVSFNRSSSPFFVTFVNSVTLATTVFTQVPLPFSLC